VGVRHGEIRSGCRTGTRQAGISGSAGGERVGGILEWRWSDRSIKPRIWPNWYGPSRSNFSMAVSTSAAVMSGRATSAASTSYSYGFCYRRHSLRDAEPRRPLNPSSTQICFLGSELRRDLPSDGAGGARLSSALSSACCKTTRRPAAASQHCSLGVGLNTVLVWRVLAWSRTRV
jgi:hypothetical protein